jgi:DNA-binding transcriptional LysR family regulator
MNWDDGRLFLAVARAGQMLGAAKALGLNQATLSRRMAALEAALGANLLIRSTSGCELTEEGEALLAALERAEAELLQAQSRFGRTGQAVSGTLRIGAPDGFGVAFLAPRLTDFASRHPMLTLQLVPVPQAFSLSKREADIAIMVGRPEHGRLVAQKLTDYTLSLYASPAYAEAYGLPRTPEALSDHRLVGYVEDLVFAPALNFTAAFWRGWRSDIEISSATGQIEAVRAGAGIGVLHDYLAVGSTDLVPVMPELSVKRAYWIVHHESLRGLARIKAATAFLNETVKREAARFVREGQ